MKKLFSFIVIFLALSQYTYISSQINLAKGKLTKQSSNYNTTSGHSHEAVDGNTSGAWRDRSITHTYGRGSNNPWWEVDLGAIYDIEKIEIWNRTDACCKNRLNNVKILIKSDASHAGVPFLTRNHTYRSGERYPLVFTGRKTGQIVRIQLLNPKGILSLAEVKVYGKKAGSNAGSTDNIAKGKRAKQSSNYSSTLGQASKAVDGNTSGNWSIRSVTHTKTSVNPWWEVDLGKIYDIDRIEIWNRTDCCKQRLDMFEIRIKNQERGYGQPFMKYHHRYKSSEIYPLVFKGQKRGRYVRIQLLNPRGILSLAEVKVYGKEVIGASPPSLTSQKSAKWPTPKNIPVCWETRGWDNEKEWVKAAVEGSWETYANINFTGWGSCNSSSDGIRIQIDDSRPHAKKLGKHIDGWRNGMVLNFSFNNWSTSLKKNPKYAIRAIAVHEFGHALGFAHEHNRNDCGCPDQEPQGTDGDYKITDCDASSIMNYCAAKWSNNGLLSPLDAQGVQQLYGEPANPPKTEYAYLKVKNEGLTKTWFKVTWWEHGKAPQSEEVYLTFNQSHRFKINKNAVIDEVEGQFLDIATWRQIFKVTRFVFTEANDEICFRVVGKDSWRCDIGRENNK
jgi:hypothetical protein